VESLKSDKSVEKIAREELGLTKPDEILIKGIEKWNSYNSVERGAHRCEQDMWEGLAFSG